MPAARGMLICRDMRRSFVVMLLGACASTQVADPKGGPRGMRATEHLEAAQRHDDAAMRRTVYPDAMSAGPIGTMPNSSMWFRSWESDEHHRLAQAHRWSAEELEANYAKWCGKPRSTEGTTEGSVSPLLKYGIGGWNTSTGVIIYLDPEAGPPDRLKNALMCHRAWMMLAPAPQMADCPLDLPGTTIDVRGDVDGITVSLSVEDRTLIGELQRRAAIELEAGARFHHNPSH
jgi:hypothetical protein